MKMNVSKVSALVATAAAASSAEMAVAQPFQTTPGTTTYTFEGGIPFSHFSNTSYPSGALPQLDTRDKTGLQTNGSTNTGTRAGGYGAFSATRNIDALNDWRFSAGFNFFDTGSRTATASGDYAIGIPPNGLFGTAQSSVTERDRFGLYTFDFDFGRNWSAGIFQVRSFAGLRSVYEKDRYDAATDKTGGLESFSDTLTGKSWFFGVGPRGGIEFSTGKPIGIVGGFSGALIGGTRQSDFTNTSFSTPYKLNANSWMANLSANLGVAWQFSPTGQLVVGYKVDQWYNVRETFTFANINYKNQDVLIQTPFIKAAFRF